MSPGNRQDQGTEPRPLFTPVEGSEETVEATGLFDPRPQDVRPWSLFERQDVVEEGLGALITQDVKADSVVEGADAGGVDVDAAMASDDVDGQADDTHLASELTDAEVVEGAETVVSGDAASEAAADLSEEGAEAGDSAALGSDGYSDSEEVADVLDETLVEPEFVADEPETCANCEATEAQAEAALDATIEALQIPYLEGSEALQRAAQDVSKDFVQNLLRLSVELAATILRRTAELDPETVLASLDGALEIAGPLSELTVRCHPEDAPLLREHGAARAEAITGRLVDVAVRPLESMPRGACIVDFEDGLVDARWDVQLERLAEAISPALIHHAAESAAEIVSETMTPPEALDERSDLARLTEDAERLQSEADESSMTLDETPPESASEVSEVAEEFVEAADESTELEGDSVDADEPSEVSVEETLEEDSE